MASLSVAACSSQNDGDMSVNKQTQKDSVADNKSPSNAADIVAQNWQLKTLEGQAVGMVNNQQRPVFFELHQDNNRVTGFSGCNTFNGTYHIEEGMRIRFTQMLSTLKACPDVAFDEQAFLEVFELTDNYSLQNGQLSLNVGRRAPLAVFEAQ